MQRYIGVDIHSKICTVTVVDGTGKHAGQHVVETNEAALVECLKMIPGDRHVCLEEGTQSAWLYEILGPHVKDLAVVDVGDSRGLKSAETLVFNDLTRGHKRLLIEHGVGQAVPGTVELHLAPPLSRG